MSSQAINLLAGIEAQRRKRPDLAVALAALDPTKSDFDVAVDVLGCTICEGKELPCAFDEYALANVRLLISGVIAVSAYCSDGVDVNLATVRDLIGGPHFVEFCRAAMAHGPYVRSRLAAYSLPASATNKSLQAIRRTAVSIIDTHCRVPKGETLRPGANDL